MGGLRCPWGLNLFLMPVRPSGWWATQFPSPSTKPKPNHNVICSIVLCLAMTEVCIPYKCARVLS